MSSLSPNSLKTYEYIQPDYIDRKHPYSDQVIYTPFSQGKALGDRYRLVDPNWNGSCYALSWSWIAQKLSRKSLMKPSNFQMKNKATIVLSDYEDIEKIRNLFHSTCLHSLTFISDDDLEKKPNPLASNPIIAFFESFYHSNMCALIGAIGSIRKREADGKDGEVIKTWGHACAFIMKADHTCAWFDPNYGEVSFKNFLDFAKWYQKETTKGRLRYITKGQAILSKTRNHLWTTDNLMIEYTSFDQEEINDFRRLYKGKAPKEIEYHF